MIIILTGLPGVGKGTYSEMLVKELNIKHLATGNLFRDTMKKDTDLANEIKSYVNNGELVPDSLSIKMLKEEVSKDIYKNGFLLDGFPRNVNQVNKLDLMLKELEVSIDYVINLELDESTIIQRLSGRLTCPNCQKSYHKVNMPPLKEGICDNCGTELVIREDDTEEKVLNRLKVAKEQTVPVIDYYNKSREVISIDTNNLTKEEAFNKIVEVIKK